MREAGTGELDGVGAGADVERGGQWALLRPSIDGSLGQAVLMRRSRSRPPAPRSSFTGFRFPPGGDHVAVRWYLRCGLSCRDVEELLAECGIEVDHVSVYRWVLRFTTLLIGTA